MDNFMEKITHKFSATDMIKANSQAEAAELESKKEQIMMFESQMEKVDNALSDLRELNLKNIESVQDIQNMTKSSSEKIEATIGRMENETVSMIKETSDISIAGINKTVDESLAKIEQIKEASNSSEIISSYMDSLTNQLIKMRSDTEEFLHSDHVKIYRNVQAAFTEELNNKTQELITECRYVRRLMPLMIITLIGVIANIAIVVLHYLGIIF